jgi:addiction module RelE/StbE family toxin
MRYISSKKFDKNFSKFPKKLKDQFIEKIQIFIRNPFDEILNNHALSGKYKGCRSINMTGDIRIIYEVTESGMAYFIKIGSHSELYR